jgi:Flp pilus assembly protein TadG
MNIISTLTKRLKRFGAAIGGQITITFGLAIVPLIATAGMALDYSAYSTAKAKLQQIADAATLAATAKFLETGSQSGLEEIAKQYVDRNIALAGLTGLRNVQPHLKVHSDSVELSITGSFETTFMKMVSISEIDLAVTQNLVQQDAKVQSQVTLPIYNEDNRGEIALVADFSSSMSEYVGGKRKYISMRDEANKLFDALSQNGTNDYVKFGLIPFSHVVKVTLPQSLFKGRNGGGVETWCIDDRNHPFNRVGDTPHTSAQDHVSKFNRTDYYGEDDTGNCPGGLGIVMPLSNNHAAVRAAMNSMLPAGLTHVSLGLEMGWHILSANEPYTEGVADLESPYHTLKSVILLTDGIQTRVGHGSMGGRNVTWANMNLEQLCTNMKAENIRVLTVAFDLRDADAVSRLRNCASDDPNRPGQKLAWNPLTNAQLSEAFDFIRKNLVRDLYVSR